MNFEHQSDDGLLFISGPDPSGITFVGSKLFISGPDIYIFRMKYRNTQKLNPRDNKVLLAKPKGSHVFTSTFLTDDGYRARYTLVQLSANYNVGFMKFWLFLHR